MPGAPWAVVPPARHRPELAQGFLTPGAALRTAHQRLDAVRLRKLSYDQHVVIGELARTARALADHAGQAGQAAPPSPTRRAHSSGPRVG
ncbi:hypothetical protein K7B10_37635 [Streptomyces flavotricini]|uniref:Uncharacterized protein n=1 Tax=Streptomyces flavotricini TaxID=66888 RepID=A0ABS8EIU4_9ACTN|nr:hypothetical protein [Streptomyces flavotricini]MCC0100402.1 hypothetical protein [Streptomyces flavotricini]